MADRVGQRIRELRQAQGLSLRTLAARAQVSVSAITAVELGTRAGLNLTAHTCLSLAKALGVPINELLTPEDDEEPAYETIEVDGLLLRQYLLPTGGGG